jgi:hypothetical protein
MNLSYVSISLILLLSYSTAHSTSILALRTPEKLFIASDSKIVAINGPETRLGCKLFISPNYIFASAGLLKDAHGLFNVRKAVELAMSSGQSFDDGLVRFEQEMLTELPSILNDLRDAVPRYFKNSLLNHPVVEAIFGTIYEGQIRLSYRGFVPNEMLSIQIIRNDCPGSACPNGIMLAELGEKNAIDAILDKNPQIWKQQGIITALNSLIEAQALATPQFVSAPAAIVMMEKTGTPQWMRPGLCAISPDNGSK